MSNNRRDAAKAHLAQGGFSSLYNKTFDEIAVNKNPRSLTPEQMFNLAVGYFTFCEEQPICALETASFQGDVYESPVHKTRVFTLRGFLVFAALTPQSYQNFRRDPDYSAICSWIDNVIYEQKYQLAANNLVNASLIGKDIGIDKPAEINVVSSTNVSGEEIKQAVSSVLSKL